MHYEVRWIAHIATTCPSLEIQLVILHDKGDYEPDGFNPPYLVLLQELWTIWQNFSQIYGFLAKLYLLYGGKHREYHGAIEVIPFMEALESLVGWLK